VTAQAQARDAGTSNSFSWRFVTPMLLGSSLNPVNSSLIATALVPIATAMHVSVGRTAVLVSGLYLASSIAQPTAGKLSEEFGPRRVFLIGILLVLAGGLVGGFAGGLGWRYSFFVNVPFALITLVMAARWIPRDPANAGRTARELAARIDLAGIVGFGGTMAALLVFLMSLPSPDWIALAVAIVAGTALVTWELRASRPFFDVRLLGRNMALTRTYLRWAILGLCVYTVLYGVT
jgi:MFS family permease